MKKFEYADDEISSKELAYSIASMTIGVGILTLPRLVAAKTNEFDGIFAIFAGACFFTFFAWFTAKVISNYPKKSFFEYTSLVLSKPVSVSLSLLFAISLLVTCSLETRIIANISTLYMFDRTPIQIVSLAFLLVVIYAVMGSRVGIIRLNLMFLPIIIFITIMVQFFNVTFIEVDHYKPFFTTPGINYLQAAQETTFSFVGYVVILSYISLMNKPKTAPKMAVIGMSVPTVLYLIIYLTVIGIFGNITTMQLSYPVIETAKEVEAPGGFLERFESIFFTVWIMTIFNTAAMAYDVTVYTLKGIFKKMKKITLILGVAPVIYLIAMIPNNTNQMHSMGVFVAIAGFFYGVIFPILIFVVGRIRGVDQNV